jgi:hypothetical protein
MMATSKKKIIYHINKFILFSIFIIVTIKLADPLFHLNQSHNNTISLENQSKSYSLMMELNITLLKGEAEGFILNYNGTNVSLSCVPCNRNDSNVKITIYRMEKIICADTNNKSYYDILFPIFPNETLPRVSKLYIKIRANDSTKPGEKIFNLSLNDNIIELHVRVLNVSLNWALAPNIQYNTDRIASTSPKAYEIQVNSSDEVIDIAKKFNTMLFNEYYFNTASFYFGAGAGKKQYTQMYDFVKRELNAKGVRLSGEPPLLSRNYNCTQYFGTNNPSDEEIEDYINRRVYLLKKLNETANEFLSGKLYDEPRDGDIPCVKKIYKKAQEMYPNITWELTEEPKEGLFDNNTSYVDRWIIAGYEFRNNEWVAHAREDGDDIWTYYNPLHSIDEKPYAMRIIGWFLWENNITGYHFWNLALWKVDPFSNVCSQETIARRRGTLVYPDYQHKTVIPSYRLEMFREGIEDYLILKKLEEKKDVNEIKEFLESVKGIYAPNNLGKSHPSYNVPDPSMYRNKMVILIEKYWN